MKLERTLVILDGLDESAGCSERILDEAKNGCHLLLLTSRSHAAHSASESPDLKVFLKGKREGHVEDQSYSEAQVEGAQG